MIDLKTTNKDGKRVISKEGIATIDYMLDMLPGGRYGREFLELQNEIDLNYRYEVDVAATKKSMLEGKGNLIFKKDKNGKRIENKKEDYYEEYVGKLVEFIKDGKIKSSPNLGSRIGRAFYPVLKKTFPKLYKFVNAFGSFSFLSSVLSIFPRSPRYLRFPCLSFSRK